jgi:PAS domain-containing protein
VLRQRAAVDEDHRECVGFFLDVSVRVARYDEVRVIHDTLEATVDAVVITDRDGRIEWVNPAFTERPGTRSMKRSDGRRGCSDRGS